MIRIDSVSDAHPGEHDIVARRVGGKPERVDGQVLLCLGLNTQLAGLLLKLCRLHLELLLLGPPFVHLDRRECQYGI